jgi:molybdate transport system substrate-binding protein
MPPAARGATTRFVVASLVTVGLVTAGCGGDDRADRPAEVVVFAAASLTEAFTELGEAFTDTNPDTAVTFSFAASSELAAQIIEGAPADVYASADLDNMAKLADVDANAGEPVVFATNVAEIVVAPGNPLGIVGVDDLTNDDLILVMCAPEAPCGSYAARIFDNAGLVVTPDSFEQNVKSVVTKVTLGEADAGIAYATDVAAAGDDVDGVEIPPALNVVAEYPIVVTTEAPDPEAAQAFVDFVISDAGQTILAGYGFRSPSSSPSPAPSPSPSPGSGP